MVRNKYELNLMRRSGYISAIALKKSLENIKSGVTALELDKMVYETIVSLRGKPSFNTVPGYNWASCITINEQVVHGIPTGKTLKEGDIVSVDLGALYKGWHTDCAWSMLVGRSVGRTISKSEDEEKKKFLEIGEQALWDGVGQAVEGSRVGDISHAIQTRIEGAGYHVVRALVGHGIGKKLHDEPEIPGYGMKGHGPLLKEGMTLAIEVIYTKGTNDVVLGADRWTYYSADGSWAGLFEMTVVVGKERAEVLTDWRHA